LEKKNNNCFDKTEPFWRQKTLAIKFCFEKRKLNLKKNLALSGHSDNPDLSILLKTQGLNFKLEMTFDFAMLWY